MSVRAGRGERVRRRTADSQPRIPRAWFLFIAKEAGIEEGQDQQD